MQHVGNNVIFFYFMKGDSIILLAFIQENCPPYNELKIQKSKVFEATCCLSHCTKG